MARTPLHADWRLRVVLAAFSMAAGKLEEVTNGGLFIRWLQKITGNKPPDFWCMSAVSRVFERALGKRCPILMTASCEQQRERAERLGALRTRAQFEALRRTDPLAVAGWIFLIISIVDGKVHAHHTGGVGVLNDDRQLITLGPRGGFLTWEGNAADPTQPSSRNGDGFYAGRERGHPDDTSTYAFIDPAAYPL